MRKMNILLIEGDEGFALIARRTIKQSSLLHSLTHVDRVSAALLALSEQQFDIVLTDLSLPDAQQLESVKNLRAAAPELPLIVLTLEESESLAVEAMRFGAQEYLIKDCITKQVMSRAIRHAIARQKTLNHNVELVAALNNQKAQLNERNERLQELVSTAHRFVDNVSHEFRTPLTVIREYSSLMRDGALGEINTQQAEFLDVMRYRIDDLNTMVDDMLDSSKLEAGIMGVQREVTSPVEVVERPVNCLKLKARVRGIDLRFDAPPDLPNVYCDSEKIGRVVTNLTANAIKFCEEGAGRVQVIMKNRPDHREVEVRVMDNGPGIEAEQLGQLFERFKQLGTSTQSSTEGFGLGLNIARELVDQNFGTIRVDSAVGIGTTFRFTIPVDNWSEIVQRFCTRLARSGPDSPVVVLTAEIMGTADEKSCRDIEAFWRFTDRQPDLVRRTDESKWTLLINCTSDEILEIIRQFKTNHAQVSRNRVRPLPTLKFTILNCFTAAETDAIESAACNQITNIMSGPHFKLGATDTSAAKSGRRYQENP